MLNLFRLKREALLFDSPLFLIKTFIGVLVAYVAFLNHPIIGRDMISVLFGMMLTLEPVTISGIKSGLSQIKATVLGGLVTALIITMMGINWVSVPLAVTLTLYISLLIDWKNISPVAIFTSIYMTQYIQINAMGAPSMLLTLRLRLMALGAGVLVAVGLNFLFSLLFYRSMIKKRIIYLLEKQNEHFVAYLDYIKKLDDFSLKELQLSVTNLFSDIDFISAHLQDLAKDSVSTKNMQADMHALEEIRLINHYFYDVLLESKKNISPVNQKIYRKAFEAFANTYEGVLKKESFDVLYFDQGIDINSYQKLYASYKRLVSIIQLQFH